MELVDRVGQNISVEELLQVHVHVYVLYKTINCNILASISVSGELLCNSNYKLFLF